MSEECKEYQVFGVPGAGKTTHLTKVIKASAEKHDGEGKHLLVSSFTKTAARELVDRELPVPPENVGTLHAICYRLMGRGELAEKHIDDFNQDNPAWALSKSVGVDVNEASSDQKFGCENDKSFNMSQMLRAKLIPVENWRDNRVQGIHEAWTNWKEANGLIDFTDMIDIVRMNEMPPPPGVTVGIFDEAQDFTPMQLDLIRMWSDKYLEYIMISGDDDQTIFSFTGASSDVFLNPAVPRKNKTFLEQSYRVPRAPLALADAWIRKVARREEKTPRARLYDGVEVEGSVEELPHNFQDARDCMHYVENMLATIPKHETIMVLAACGYMLGPLISEMKRAGIPFSNRFRRSHGAWNPLGTGRGVSSAKKLWNYLTPTGGDFGESPIWSIEQLCLWVDLCEAKGFLKKGAKTTIMDASKNAEMDADQVASLIFDTFETDHIDKAMALDAQWLWERLLRTKENALNFPMAVLKRYGKQALVDEPRLTVGTVHSVKGGQADHVILFPDISLNAAQSASASTAGKDAIIRQFYVGMTRCRQSLHIARPQSSFYAPIGS